MKQRIFRCRVLNIRQMTSNIGPFRFFVRMGCFFVPILECSAFLVTQRKTKTLQRMSNATFFGRRRMSSPNLHLGSLPRGALHVRLAIAIVQRHQKSKKCVVRRNFYAFISGLAEPPPKSRMRRRVLRRLPGGELRISRKRPFSAQTARRRIENFKEATLFPAAKLHRRGPRPPTGGRRERETRHRASGVSAYVDAPRGFWAAGGRLDAPAYVDAPRGFWALGGRLGAFAYANAQQKIC